MKRFFKHDLTQMCIGFLFLFVFWLMLPADPQYVDQAVVNVRKT